MLQYAVRWQSKTFCGNLAYHVGSTLGLHNPTKSADKQSVPLSKKFISIQKEQDLKIKTL